MSDELFWFAEVMLRPKTGNWYVIHNMGSPILAGAIAIRATKAGAISKIRFIANKYSLQLIDTFDELSELEKLIYDPKYK